jgi:membrane-anchored protein YejM (alkaline phosphatase superfamily)
MRVNSVLNEINELNHDGTAVAPLPALFGMNFQAVNSAKKSSLTSGYLDSLGTMPDDTLRNALSFVDKAIGSMLSAFPQGQLKKTAIVITAKHGESPLSNTRTVVLTSTISKVLNLALNSSGTVGIKFNKITQKTSALIWLADPADTMAAVSALSNASAVDPVFAAHLSQVLSFGSGLPFPQPGTTPGTDPAPPDIVVVMNDGVNFEPSLTSTTYAEHGGFGEPESHVPLLISNPGCTGSSVTSTVSTRQIAPTVLALLGLDPNALQAVQIEGTSVLPSTCP